MNGLNINVALCESYNESTMSVNKFFNEVKAEDNKAVVCIFSMLSYIGKEEVSIGLDYFVKCVLSEDEKYKDTKIPLFSIEINGKQVGEAEDYKVFESIIAQPREIKFPSKGMYEIQVYKMEKDVKGIDKATERYKRYREKNVNPISAYRFFVK
ncbi:MAG: hypothetical protein MR696_09075 [Lachnospiraceae bacterium]|nr:hypothetical protein [Lachnospiraceae bacterium]